MACLGRVDSSDRVIVSGSDLGDFEVEGCESDGRFTGVDEGIHLDKSVCEEGDLKGLGGGFVEAGVDGFLPERPAVDLVPSTFPLPPNGVNVDKSVNGRLSSVFFPLPVTTKVPPPMFASSPPPTPPGLPEVPGLPETPPLPEFPGFPARLFPAPPSFFPWPLQLLVGFFLGCTPPFKSLNPTTLLIDEPCNGFGGGSAGLFKSPKPVTFFGRPPDEGPLLTFGK